MVSRLLTSLHKLLKLQDYHIQQLRQQIALVSMQVELRENLINKNISYVNTERLIASVNIGGSDSLSAFVNRKLFENKQYADEILSLNETLEKLQEQLLSDYGKLKQFDKVRENEQQRINSELIIKESMALNEVAIQAYSFKFD